jgi:conjugal transfer mating pair stabilization protein TraN
MIRKLVSSCLALFLQVGVALAGDCKKSSSVCVDSTACKSISGNTLCLSDVGLDCWEYQDTYNCIKENAVNYCAPFQSIAGCYQTSSSCAEPDLQFGTGCMRLTQTWRCDSPVLPQPSNTIRLDDTYTLIQDSIDTSQCDAYAASSSCDLAEHRCVEGAETRIINGLPVYKDCWHWEDRYTCISADSTSDCAELVSRGCTSIATTCIESLPDGRCTLNESTYSCQISPEETREVMDCTARSFCTNGVCFDTGFEPDADFGKAVAAMESAREAGVYIDPDTLLLFTGAGSKCTKKLGGLVNCCKGGSGGGAGMSNQALAGQMLSNAGDYVASVGSPYMFDAMFSSDLPWLMDKAVDAWSSNAWSPAFNPSLSFYGVTAQVGGAVPAGATALGSVGNVQLYFNPATFYLAIAVMVIQELISCEQEDQLTAMKKSQNLCVSLGSYCSSKILKVCVEKKEGYCCFNSRLARIIQEQGRAQLGKSWGSAKSPECSGFTLAEFESLDFSQIDLTEFIREIQPKAMDVQALTDRMNSRVQTMANQ